jgi:hypothetical protein
VASTHNPLISKNYFSSRDAVKIERLPERCQLLLAVPAR